MPVELTNEDRKTGEDLLAQAREETEKVELQQEPQAESAPKADQGKEANPQATEEEPQSDTEKKPEEQRGDVRAALRAARQAERRAKAEIERLRQENETLRQGKPEKATEISDEEIAELEHDFPAQAIAIREAREAKAKLAELEKLVKAGSSVRNDDEFQPVEFDPNVQAEINKVSELWVWQHDPESQDKFKKAIETDIELSAQPEWKFKPLHERFAEVVKRVNAPSPQRRDPADVIANAPATKPERISQMHGGAAPTRQTPDYSRMSDEDIFASLRTLSE